MNKYNVTVMERYGQTYVVEAESPEKAMDIVKEGGGKLDENSFEYIDRMDRETWQVHEHKTTNCPTCGKEVRSIFDHVDQDCEAG